VGHSLTTPAGLTRVSFDAMGTRVEVLLPGPQAGCARAVDGLFSEWENELSRFRPSSGLSRLNAMAGRPAPAGSLLRRVVRRALDAAAATGGVFDPLLGRQLEEVGYDVTFDRIAPSPPSDDPPTPGGAWRHVALDDAAGVITLPAGARLDLGGIAKGMAVDASISLLRSLGVESALVSAGGDIAVIPRPEGWPVEVQTHAGPAVVALLRGAIATSTTRRRRWFQAGVERHHLLDPASGLPARSDVHSATVTAGSCEVAEVAAKVALVLGRDRGSRFLADRGLTGLLVEESGSTSVGSWPVPLAAAS
jgi:FAD:protein FMN transferase